MDNVEKPRDIKSAANPYLQQHAKNPVDWLEWTDAAFAEAARRNVPVFLSIGYSACHWCHVMSFESFEDPVVAEYLNQNFVCIKLDREERPDLDQIYQLAHQLITERSGGWPLSLWLLPDKTPFFAGTYFPKTDRHGQPAFLRILQKVKQVYDENPGQLAVTAAELHLSLKQLTTTIIGNRIEPWDLIKTAIIDAQTDFDKVDGGFGEAPKFPPSTELELLMFIDSFFPNEIIQNMVDKTLLAMGRGGIFDHVGGGFHRYAVSGNWLVPHFEKMLYDQALLAPLYVKAFERTGNSFFMEIAEQTCDFVLSEMSTNGSFATSFDADFHGAEGEYYLWSAGELNKLLGHDFERFADLYTVSESGNYNGLNILSLKALAPGLTMPHALAGIHRTLCNARQKRGKPDVDSKLITAWNALFIKALYAAGRQQPRYAQKAASSLEHIWSVCVDLEEELVWRIYYRDHTRQPGMLEDYVYLIDALLADHSLTLQQQSLDRARTIAEFTLARFLDEESGGFFDADKSEAAVIVRNKAVFDSPLPSAYARSIEVFSALSLLTGDNRYAQAADDSLDCAVGVLQSGTKGLATLAKAAISLGIGLPVVELDEPNRSLTARLLSRFPETIIRAGAKLHGCHNQVCRELSQDSIMDFAVVSMSDAIKP